MAAEYWSPRVARSPDLVRPVRLDPSGRRGPTRGQVQGRRWRRSSHGWYVPSYVDQGVEQRILEQSVRLPAVGALTGWAALRWRGAAYFEGVDRTTGAVLPVPVVLGGWADIGRDPGIAVSRERFWPHEIEDVCGVPCAIVERAAFDEIRTRSFRSAVVAVEMVLAAGLSSVLRVQAYVAGCQGWTGVPHAREVVKLIRADSRSPQETRMRLVWELDAGLPRPLCNQPLFDLHENLLGIPDLLDPVAGVVGEYDGSDHTQRDRRASDASREHRFREHGLEYFEVVGGDLRRPPHVVHRMVSTRRRARFLPPERRAWTLQQPDWWLRRNAA